MKQTHGGGCQCGKVRYEATFELGEVISCNCSRCGRLGGLLAALPKSDFELISGAGAMTEYQFHKHAIHHLFCSTCGIQSYSHGTGPGGAEMVMVNVRTIDDVDVEALKVTKFDGRKF
jgi:hypothetical protein